MSLNHIFIPLTPRLDELVAAVVLGDQTPLPTKGTAELFQHAWPTDTEVELKKEIFRMVRAKRALF